MCEAMDSDAYRAELLDVGASVQDADRAAEQLRSPRCPARPAATGAADTSATAIAPGPATSPAVLRPSARPCGECPWRVDQPVGRFAPERYRALAGTVAGPDGSAPLGAPMFACHKSVAGREIPCAGWLAVEGHGHVGVRLAVATGRLEAATLVPGSDWPELYPSFAAMTDANGSKPLPRPVTVCPDRSAPARIVRNRSIS